MSLHLGDWTINGDGTQRAPIIDGDDDRVGEARETSPGRFTVHDMAGAVVYRGADLQEGLTELSRVLTPQPPRYAKGESPHQQKVRAVLDTCRHIANTTAPNPNRSHRLDWYSTPGGLVIVQCWKDGGVEVYAPLTSSNSMAELLGHLRQYVGDTSQPVPALTDTLATLRAIQAESRRMVRAESEGGKPDDRLWQIDRLATAALAAHGAEQPGGYTTEGGDRDERLRTTD